MLNGFNVVQYSSSKGRFLFFLRSVEWFQASFRPLFQDVSRCSKVMAPSLMFRPRRCKLTWQLLFIFVPCSKETGGQIPAAMAGEEETGRD